MPAGQRLAGRRKHSCAAARDQTFTGAAKMRRSLQRWQKRPRGLRARRLHSDDFVFDAEFGALEIADARIVGMRAGVFRMKRRFDGSVTGFKRLDTLFNCHAVLLFHKNLEN
jgi:hypothetical protein